MQIISPNATKSSVSKSQLNQNVKAKDENLDLNQGRQGGFRSSLERFSKHQDESVFKSNADIGSLLESMHQPKQVRVS